VSDTRIITTCTVCGGLLQRHGSANGDFWVAVSIAEPYPNRCQAECRPGSENDLPPYLADYFLFGLDHYGISDETHRRIRLRCVWYMRHPVRTWQTRGRGL
jgi:hypothetical protein